MFPGTVDFRGTGRNLQESKRRLQKTGLQMNRHYDGTSEALLTAAHRLLAEDGPEALTVRRIAGEAGMSTMNVYSRFGGKDGVIDELYADGYRRLVTEIDSVPETDDVPADLMRVADTSRAVAKANPT